MNAISTFAAHHSQNDRAACWAAAFAAMEEAKARHDHHTELVWRRLGQELSAAAPRPDLWFEVAAQSGQVARFDVSSDDPHAWDNHVSPIFREAAGKVRDAWLAHAAARDRLNWEVIAEENEALCGRHADAEDELVLTPAPDLSALWWKFDFIFGPEARGPEGFGVALPGDWVDALMADIARLLRS